MQILSDVLLKKLYLSEEADGCPFGAFSAIKAGEGEGFFKFEFKGKTLTPNQAANEKYQLKFNKYNKNLF